jgi:hemerythrin-like domain-containing protein
MCDHCGCRAFAPIGDLTAEHDDILQLAWQVAQAHRGGQPDPIAAGRLLAVLDVHVQKEETGLYPLLLDEGGLLPERSDELEAEHVAVRAALVNGTFDRRDYYALAAHVEEEEVELFPAAMFGFDDEGWDTMAAAHERADAASTASHAAGPRS